MIPLFSGFFATGLTHSHLLLLPFFIAGLMLLALACDRLFGEPSRGHPLVAFGRWAAWLEHCFNVPEKMTEPTTVIRGLFVLILVLSPLLPLALLFIWIAQQSVLLWVIVQVLVLYSCIGWQSLQQHVLAVATALEQNDIASAREKLSWIVSRDTAQLSADEIAQADIESLLENTSDALFASLFWFAVGGALPVLLHRWVNTLDAMWGYRNPRFNYFGRAAARLDDVLAYWPARLTAWCFILAGPNRKFAWRCWHTQAKDCASPNGGAVMTAGAGALNIRLSERACYHGVWKNKPPMGCGMAATAKHILPTIQLVKRSIRLFFLLWLCVSLLITTIILLVFGG